MTECEFCETNLATQTIADCKVCDSENCVELASLLIDTFDSFDDEFEFDFAEDYAD